MIEEKNFLDNYWNEYFRPKSLDKMILLPRVRKQFETGLHKNFIISGSSGTGKTTLARILIKNNPHKHFKSKERLGINDIETKLNDFCTSFNFESGTKIVFFDEFMVTADFQEAIRGFIEDSSAKGIKWLITTNYPSKIIPSMKSRFTLLDFEPQNQEEIEYLKNEYLNRLEKMCVYTKLEYTVPGLENIINKTFPDFRNAVEILNAHYISNEKIETILFNNKNFYTILSDTDYKPDSFWTFCKDSYSKEPEKYIHMCGRDYINWIINNKPEFIKNIPDIANEFRLAQRDLDISSDPLIILYTLMLTIKKINTK